jgi:cell division protein ZapA (FtsZ GTPase activity inhibitor)
MADEKSEIRINIKIAGRNYPLTIQTAEEEYVRKAAETINNKIREYADSFSAQDSQDLLAIVALENATHLLKNSQYSPETFLNKIQEELKSLEKHLESI